jgi:hypothetical protein
MKEKSEKYTWDSKLSKGQKVKLITRSGFRFKAIKGKIKDIKDGKITIIDKNSKEYTRKNPMKLWTINETINTINNARKKYGSDFDKLKIAAKLWLQDNFQEFKKDWFEFYNNEEQHFKDRFKTDDDTIKALAVERFFQEAVLNPNMNKKYLQKAGIDIHKLLNERVDMMKKVREKFGPENLQKLMKAGELWLKDNYKTWKKMAFEDFYDPYRNNDIVMQGFALEEFFSNVLRGNDNIKPYLKKSGFDIKKLTEQKQFSIKNKHYDYSKFDQEQLRDGIKIEKEHTDNIEVAKQVASDHLKENPNYYKILKKNKLEELSLIKIFNESKASEEAKKKGLTHKGYGKWANKSGDIVAQTKGDTLVPVKNTGQHIPSSAGNITKATGSKAVKKSMSKMKAAFNPLLKTNNIKYGEYVILKNGKRYRKEQDDSFRNMNDPKDIKFSNTLEDESPISHGETPEGQKKQARRFDIDKEVNWNKKIQSSNIGDILINKNGQQFKVGGGIGKTKIAIPYSKYQQAIDTAREKEKNEPVKKIDNSSENEKMNNFRKQQAEIPIGIKKEDPENKKYKLNMHHIESLNNQAKELFKAGKDKEGLLITNIASNIAKYGNYISKKQAKLLYMNGVKLNWK